MAPKWPKMANTEVCRLGTLPIKFKTASHEKIKSTKTNFLVSVVAVPPAVRRYSIDYISTHGVPVSKAVLLKKSPKNGGTPVFGHFGTCRGKGGNMGLKLEFEPAGTTTQRVAQTWGSFSAHGIPHIWLGQACCEVCLHQVPPWGPYFPLFH